MARVGELTVTVRFSTMARAFMAALRAWRPGQAAHEEERAMRAELARTSEEFAGVTFSREQWHQDYRDVASKLDKTSRELAQALYDFDASRRALESANEIGFEWQRTILQLREDVRNHEGQMAALALVIERAAGPHTIAPGTPADRVRILHELNTHILTEELVDARDAANSPQVILKEHHELRHFLAHLYAAIEAVRTGHTLVAEQELESVAGLVFFDNDTNEALERELTTRGEDKHGSQTQEPVQG